MLALAYLFCSATFFLVVGLYLAKEFISIFPAILWVLALLTIKSLDGSYDLSSTAASAAARTRRWARSTPSRPSQRPVSWACLVALAAMAALVVAHYP